MHETVRRLQPAQARRSHPINRGKAGMNKDDGRLEFDYACQQEADERDDEIALYRDAEQDEIRCALALFRSLAKDFGEYRAVRVDGPLNWTITKPRTAQALQAAIETDEPATALQAAQPLIERLNVWERFQANRYGRSAPDGKRIEVRVGDLRQLRSAKARAEGIAQPPTGDPSNG
jgi:hypothetical protein